MDPRTLELMQNQVRAIYRALTGNDLPQPEGEAPRNGASSVDPEGIARLFAELDAMARGIPQVAARVPPFSFSPPIDVLDSDRELLIEAGVPGVAKKDVQVELKGDLLTISGIRDGEHVPDGRTYLHGEIPRGPFHRVVRLPYASSGEPRVEVVQGLIRIRLAKSSKSASAQA